MARRKVRRPGTWTIAVIRGVDLNIHFSLLFLLLYVVLVSAAQFPLVAAGAGLSPFELSMGPWVAGLVVAFGIFLSVTLHEFGHILVAQAQGVPVRGITLMMLGGMSEMGHLPEKKYGELKVAIMGPVVSFLIAGVMSVIRDQASSPDVVLLAYWLGSANLILAIFNLIPALPLDGGRVLRSLIAARSGEVRATKVAVAVSKVFSWTLGLIGLFSFNVLMVLIAFFIYSAANTELYMSLTRGVLRGLTVSDIVVRVPPALGHEPLSAAATQMLRSKKTVVPVMLADNSPSVVSTKDLLRIPRDQWNKTLLSDVILPAQRVLDVNEPVTQILTDMLAASSRALPVTDQGKLIGLLRDTDVSELLEFRSIEEASEKATNTELLHISSARPVRNKDRGAA